jgi:hypothetical protein
VEKAEVAGLGDGIDSGGGSGRGQRVGGGRGGGGGGGGSGSSGGGSGRGRHGRPFLSAAAVAREEVMKEILLRRAVRRGRGGKWRRRWEK